MVFLKLIWNFDYTTGLKHNKKFTIYLVIKGDANFDDLTQFHMDVASSLQAVTRNFKDRYYS